MSGKKTDYAEEHKYDDMLDMPHYKDPNHPPMPLLNRAAQFSPFAALTGYEDAVDETARLVDQRRELSEEDIELLNWKLQALDEHLGNLGKNDEKPSLEICYFKPDGKKQGGAYATVPAQVRRIDFPNRTLVLVGGARISFDDIFGINGGFFDEMLCGNPENP